MTDPISDMINRIMTSLNIKNESLDLPHSKVKEAIAAILMQEGYIKKFDVMTKMNKKFIRLALKYRKNRSGVIAFMKRVSRPGCRTYSGVGTLPRVQNGFGTAIISTSQGIMTDQIARAKKLGGEVLCVVG